ncbi:MAG: protein translocase subunit SecF [Spirochaetes bacterium]|nr:protein translocase subunit SecF [Spirochaetota bacterium]
MERTIKFMEYRWIGYLITLFLFIIFIIGTIKRGGFNWGIDFVGGYKIIVKFPNPVQLSEIRRALENAGIKGEVQQYGDEINNEYVISTRLQERGRRDESQSQGITVIENAITSAFPNTLVVGREEVGPAIGDYLKKSALYLIAWCLVFMMLYLAFRFEFRFAVGALVAVIHDVLLSLLFCGFVGIEINIPIVAGVLTIFGYSINDTIVVYDRIRENMENMAKQSFKEISNRSISQTLNRTILTTVTTLMAVLCLYIMGEAIINDFALLLLFGFTMGIFSTVFVATPVIYEWKRLSKEA